ncbi:aspartyl-phosphate phosphatase Spo0E family protein [Bacillus sp. 2205SS5-2]|uniref:aspartyl-phosphate phosphatase Spo0E family protein n=1 Tax=Bacillus sp. 2205SS5-2 TaxID=3109031 RepID=UPI00300489EA
MKRSKQDLLNRIEDCRTKMVQLALQSSFADDQVIHISTQLDDLINQYQRNNLI